MGTNRIYRVDTNHGREATCWFEADKPTWCRYLSHTTGSNSNGPDNPGFREATADEISAFEAEEQKRKDRAEAIHKQEAELLSLAGLTHDDFVRFRGVYRDGGTLYVCTRENGVNDISVGAIRNANYRSRENDDGDSTYANYEFAIPSASPRDGKGGERS